MPRSIYLAAGLAASLVALAGQAAEQGIYTCVDSKGRRLTADRPIIDCIDREQLELNSSGLPRRRIAPTPTAAERAAEEEKARLLEEERNRVAEEKRRERALVIRYPDRASHDQERQAALELVDNVTAASQRRTKDLLEQRKFLEREMEFYQVDPSRMPAKLRRQLTEVDTQVAAQRRFVADQEVEKVRVNARFDEELSRLKPLWAQQVTAPATGARATSGPVPAGRPASAAKAAR